MLLNKIMNISKSLFLILILSYTSLLYAEDNSTKIYKDIDLGIELEYIDDGSNWKRIRSFDSADLNFGDRADIQQATKIAILRAKANIVKFMKEKIQAEDTLDEIAKTLVKTDKNGKLISKSAARKTSTALIEKITSSSNAILKGILLLEKEVNKEEAYVKVTVGVSRKSMRIADSLKYNFKKDSQIEDEKQQKPNSSDKEIRRSKNYDNF